MSGQHIFISHATADDAFVKELRIKLELHGLTVWVDSRNLAAGNKLTPEIEQAIRNSRHVIAVLSPRTINSPWVRKEIRCAEDNGHNVIPLMLPGIEPTALGMWFDEEPVGVKIELDPGKLNEALPRILAALGERLPDDLPTAQQVENKPLAELLLKLTRPSLVGASPAGDSSASGESPARQAPTGGAVLSAEAELVFYPADLSKEREVKSRPFRFTAPIGQIEQDELRWYLEDYLHWPVGLFRERAQRLEAQLPQWGEKLFAEVLNNPACQEVKSAWHNTRTESERLFSVLVETALLEDASDAEKANANTAASRLQSLPWELLHDGKGYVSDGKYPVRIRRRLPNYDQKPPSITQLPIRILLLSPRPEQAGVGYIDHRASALPLVAAVEALGDLAELSVLTLPTLGALEQELRRASEAGKPYHVVHFDGHGVYDQQHGLGALCFEDPQDSQQLSGRRMQLVHADKLAVLLRDYRIPLVFLEACQTAQTDTDPSASVAAKLLEEGIASVVAMSHSVLVATARRFVTQFYRTLAEGQRIGKAMLAGQTELMRDTFRLPIAGAGDLHLQDWFVPILYQEQHDPQLFARLPSATAQLMTAQQHQTRRGRLPEPPPHSFIGRSRELLQVERLLERPFDSTSTSLSANAQGTAYAVLRGQGGAGKTTLAVELARWLVQSRRFERCAFVSVEQYTHSDYVLEQLLQQLVNANHNFAAEYASDTDKALQAIRRVLENERVLIVVDNVEALLADGGNVGAVLGLLKKIPSVSPFAKGSTLQTGRDFAGGSPPLQKGEQGGFLLFTTRESLPEPFHHKAREIVLGALSVTDAKALVMQVMNNEGLHLRHDDQGNTPQEVDDLVGSVGCHARALVLLARELAQRGVKASTANLRAIMQELEQRHPGQRELSLFASVELSLRRLSPDVREQIAGLAVFQDGGNWRSIHDVLNIEEEQTFIVIGALSHIGLVQVIGDYGYIRFDPALPSYLSLNLNKEKQKFYRNRWLDVMGNLVDFLYQQHFHDSILQSNLIRLEKFNLMAYLNALAESIQDYNDAQILIEKASNIEILFTHLHDHFIIEKTIKWREIAAQHLKNWNHHSFHNERMTIEQLKDQGHWELAYNKALSLLIKCEQTGEKAYPEANYDLAMANALVALILRVYGDAERALSYLRTAQYKFDEIGEQAENMSATTSSEQGHCLFLLGNFTEAESAYKKALKYNEHIKNLRGVATDKSYLANIKLQQRHYEEALSIYQECLSIFNELGEPVAKILYQIGMTYRYWGKYPDAEKAYRDSLAIEVKLNNQIGQAHSLHELGNLYNDWSLTERSIGFYQEAAKIYQKLNELSSECLARSNLASMLLKLERYNEVRVELMRAVKCSEARSYESSPWM